MRISHPLLLFIFFVALSAALLHSGFTANAVTTDTVNFTPQVSIPGSTFVETQPTPVTGTTIGEWVSAVYVFFAGIVGIISALMVLWGGIKWITASGNAGRVGDAKSTIYSAIIALLLTFGSYIILNTINPQLVKIRSLADLVLPIERIEQAMELPRRISEVIFGNSGLAGQKNYFNSLNCPSLEELRGGVDVFLTGYYRPSWPQTNEEIWQPSGGYPNFPCNVGMQCSCPRDKTKQCQAGGLTWNPCDVTKMDPSSYCNKTASGSKPVELFGENPPYTAAASPCFGFGTVFTLSRTNGSGKVFTNDWTVSDRGGDIQGRHLDLFMGTGEPSRVEAVNITGTATMRVKRFCTSPENCTDLTQ